VFFHDLDEGEKRALPGWRDCILCRDEESGGIRIELDDVSEIQPLQWQEALPEGKWNPDDSALTLPQELFCALDRKAMHQAALIYQTLVLGSTRPRSKEGLAAYANFCCRLNTAYLWSGMGQLMSREVLDHVQSFYPGHYSTKKIKRFASLIGSNTYVFDCSGLIKSYYFGGLGAPEYEESRDWNSNMLFERAVRKGPLSSLPEEPGLCVYKKNHVGVYLHGGWVVESSPKPGELGGVHLSALDEGDWESWFACPL
jgi:hypothetical protein